MTKTLFSFLLVLLFSACAQNDNSNRCSSHGAAGVTTTPLDTSARTIVTGPDTGVTSTEAYVTQVAKEDYFRAWPILSMYNSRMGLVGPPIIVPLNRFVLLTDDVIPKQCAVACPNQDIAYGIGCLALDQSPVVIHLPDFGDRFWPYQALDQRTDGFVPPGKMYGTKPGFYLLADPNCNGDDQKGITKVFRPITNTRLVGRSVFMDDG